MTRLWIKYTGIYIYYNSQPLNQLLNKIYFSSPPVASSIGSVVSSLSASSSSMGSSAWSWKSSAPTVSSLYRDIYFQTIILFPKEFYYIYYTAYLLTKRRGEISRIKILNLLKNIHPCHRRPCTRVNQTHAENWLGIRPVNWLGIRTVN